jgi:hypothetical protein
MIPDSFRNDLQILPLSASYRYSMLVSTLQRLWKAESSGLSSSQRTPRTPQIAPLTTTTAEKENELLYDGLLQQLEDTFQELHCLMLDLGVTELVDDVDFSSKTPTAATHFSTAAKRTSDGTPAEPGTVTFLPCKVRSALL